MKTIVLHIGLHKTGTTSFQAVMHDWRDIFIANGVDPYSTKRCRKYGRAKHGDIAFSCMRSGVLDNEQGEILFNYNKDKKYEEVGQEIRGYIKNSKSDKLLFSAEAISLLRTSDEFLKLRKLFGNDVIFHIIVCLREKSDWLKSYQVQHLKEGIDVSPFKSSAFYTKDDSWLLDHDGLVEELNKHFEKVTVLNYEKNDMVGRLCGVLEVDLKINTQAYRRNRSPNNIKLSRLFRKSAKLLLGSEDVGLRKILRGLLEKYKSKSGMK